MESEKQANEDAAKDAGTSKDGNSDATAAAAAAAATTTATTVVATSSSAAAAAARGGGGDEARAQLAEKEEEDREEVRQCLENVIELACATATAIITATATATTSTVTTDATATATTRATAAAAVDTRATSGDVVTVVGSAAVVSAAGPVAVGVGSQEAIAPCADAGLEPADEKAVNPVDDTPIQEQERKRKYEEAPVAASATAGEPAAAPPATAAVAETEEVEAATTAIAVATAKEVTESGAADHAETNRSETPGEDPLREGISCAARTSSSPRVVCRAGEPPPPREDATIGLVSGDIAGCKAVVSVDNNSLLIEGEKSPRKTNPEASAACARLPGNGVSLGAQPASTDALVGDSLCSDGGCDDMGERGGQAVNGLGDSAGEGQGVGQSENVGQEEGRTGEASRPGLGSPQSCADGSRACRGSSASTGSQSGCTTSDYQGSTGTDDHEQEAGAAVDTTAFRSLESPLASSSPSSEPAAAIDKERPVANSSTEPGEPAEPACVTPPHAQLQGQAQSQVSKAVEGDDAASGKGGGGSATQSADDVAVDAGESVEASASDFSMTASGCRREEEESAASTGPSCASTADGAAGASVAAGGSGAAAAAVAAVAAATAAAAPVADACVDGVNDSDVAPPKNPLHRLTEPPARAGKDKKDPHDVDLYGCLDHFMAEEKLVAADGNGYDCESCRAARPKEGGGEGAACKQDARKRLLMLGEPPGMLVCHLKRLQAKKKIIRGVEFPLQLDMAPYFWQDPSVSVVRFAPGQLRLLYRFVLFFRERCSSTPELLESAL